MCDGGVCVPAHSAVPPASVGDVPSPCSVSPEPRQPGRAGGAPGFKEPGGGAFCSPPATHSPRPPLERWSTMEIITITEGDTRRTAHNILSTLTMVLLIRPLNLMLSVFQCLLGNRCIHPAEPPNRLMCLRDNLLSCHERCGVGLLSIHTCTLCAMRNYPRAKHSKRPRRSTQTMDPFTS